MIDLTERVCVVTGAGRGIGRAIATTLVQQGAALVLNDLDVEPLKETEVLLREQGAPAVEIVAGDVGVRADAEAVIARANDAFGALHGLVNCAGLWRDAMALKLTEEMWDLVIRVNLTGTWFMTQAAYPLLKVNGGSIVNFTSQSGIAGNVGQANYSAAKAGIIGLTKSNAKEFARHRIRVNAVAPASAGTRAVESMPEQFVEQFTAKIPFGRMGEPAEIASGVAFLLSDDAGFITGQVIGIDGGFSIGNP